MVESAMGLTVDIPPDIAEILRTRLSGPLEVEVLEAAAVEWYRQGRLLHGQLARLLGISRNEADGVLKRHGVVNDLSSAELEEEIEAALRTGER